MECGRTESSGNCGSVRANARLRTANEPGTRCPTPCALASRGSTRVGQHNRAHRATTASGEATRAAKQDKGRGSLPVVALVRTSAKPSAPVGVSTPLVSSTPSPPHVLWPVAAAAYGGQRRTREKDPFTRRAARSRHDQPVLQALPRARGEDGGRRGRDGGGRPRAHLCS